MHLLFIYLSVFTESCMKMDFMIVKRSQNPLDPKCLNASAIQQEELTI